MNDCVVSVYEKNNISDMNVTGISICNEKINYQPKNNTLNYPVVIQLLHCYCTVICPVIALLLLSRFMLSWYTLFTKRFQGNGS